MLKQFKTLAELSNAFSDNRAAIDHFRAIRWKNGEFCPHCGHDKIYKPKDKGRYTCAQCEQRFSPTIRPFSRLETAAPFGSA